MLYTNEQIQRANSTELAAFLHSQGERTIKSGKEVRWTKYDSVTIYGNQWFRHSRKEGGYPIEFVMKFWDVDFPEAVKMLIGEDPKGEGNQTENSTKMNGCKADCVRADYTKDVLDSTEMNGTAKASDFNLPDAAADNALALNYLVHTRGISSDIADYFIRSGSIYQSEDNRCLVFVGFDPEGLPRYGFRRGVDSSIKMDVRGSDKAFGFGYTGTGDNLYVFEAAIDLLSFLSLYPENWKESSYLALGGVADKALLQFLCDHTQIRTVVLCLDSDEAGDTASNQIGEEMIKRGLKTERMRPVLKDWNEVVCHLPEVTGKALLERKILGHEPEKYEEKTVDMICLNDVEQTEVEWLWYPYIPFGKLTLLQGNPGEGKTWLAMQLAAACTNQKELPGRPASEPFNVIYQTAEDGLGDTVKPRLMEAGANLERVLTINDTDKQLTLSDERIELALRQTEARLLIIDPIQAYLGANVDMNRANEVRPIVRKLGDYAQRYHCAVLLIGHLNKAAGMQSTYRGLGSIDFTASVRSLLFIGKQRDDPTVRLLTHEKSSLAPNGPSLAFILGDEDGFRWIGEVDITADQMLMGITEEKKDSKVGQARELILTMLEGGKHVFSSDIDRAAMEKGISSRTVRDAKALLRDRLKSRITTGKQKEYWMEVKQS